MAGSLTPQLPAMQVIRVRDLAGEDLFTLLLPDNKVVSKVLQTDWFTERLFTPWKHYPALKQRRVPSVAMLLHSDIATF